jgi:predicted RNA-binding protein with PUA-like domain
LLASNSAASGKFCYRDVAEQRTARTFPKDMVLVKSSRLSVQPVTPEEWKKVSEMGGVKG